MTVEEIFQTMRELVAGQFAMEPAEVSMETSFEEDLGADSVDLMDLSMALEEEFGMEEMDSDEIESIVTVGDLYKYMQEHLDI